MDIKFLGGASEVGSLAILLEENGTSLLFDYGMTPSNPPGFPMNAPRTDGVFLTHAHVDHSAMIPQLVKRHMAAIVATPMTAIIGAMLMADSLKVAGREGFIMPYGPEDVEETVRRFDFMDFGDVVEVGDMEVQLHAAGHIPGAAMYEARGDRTVLVTGDVNTIDTPLVRKASPVKSDILVMESTYAGREHEPRRETEHRFLDKIREVVERGGRAIIPAFAVGRTQEIMLLLKDSGYDIWLDGMGRGVNRLMLEYPEYLANATNLRRAKQRVREVRSARGREKHAVKGEVIITTSGMMDGGPILSYLQHFKNDKRNAILLTGYQVEGSNARMLRDKGYVDIDGELTRVDCEVEFFDFSAHAGHTELVNLAKYVEPEDIVLCHGDNREALLEDLSEFTVHLPKEGEVLRL